MRLFRSFRDDRALLRRSSAYAAALMVEPTAPEVDWLATSATRGDRDHAEWELRYLRRSLGILVAQRDALDDRTASAVARVLEVALARDPAIDAAKRVVAQKQINSRLRAYGDALTSRNAPEATSTRL
ncbi:MAG: hypothetical protein ABIY52_10395, partial [Gemmatimonadaceae bacterium]